MRLLTVEENRHGLEGSSNDPLYPNVINLMTLGSGYQIQPDTIFHFPPKPFITNRR